MAATTAYSVITANGLLGGVGVWSLRLSEWSAAHRSSVRWVTVVLRNEYTEDQTGWFLPEAFPNVTFWDYSALDQKPRLLRALAEYLAEADVVLPNYVVAAWDAVAMLKQVRNCRSLPRVIGVCHSDHELFYRWIRDFGPTLDAAVAVSRHCLQELRARCELTDVPLHQLPYGVPVPPVVEDRPPAPPLRLVYVGRLSERQKRVSLLVRLAEELLRRRCPFALEVYGDGPDREALVAALRKGPHDLMQLREPLAYGQLNEAFKSAHVQLLLSDHEGLPIALLEGMAHGVVPVATAIASGIPELISSGTNGFTVPVDDPVPSAAELLTELVRAPEKLAELSAAARATVLNYYSLDRVAPQWLELVASLRAVPARVAPSSWRPPVPTGFGRTSVLDRTWLPRGLVLWLRHLRHRRNRSSQRRAR